MSSPYPIQESFMYQLKEVIQEILQCPICLEKLTAPKTCLQCKTNFCNTCLKVITYLTLS